MSTCPDLAHVHGPQFVVMPRSWMVVLDGRCVATCPDEETATRLAELLNEHGIVPIPDRIPDELVWGPPASGQLIDFRLPADPTKASQDS